MSMERRLETDDVVYMPYSEGNTSQHNGSWVIKEATVKSPADENGRLRIELNQNLRYQRKVEVEEVFTAEEAANVMQNAEPALDWEEVDLSEPKSRAVELLKQAVTARQVEVS